MLACIAAVVSVFSGLEEMAIQFQFLLAAAA